jgi:hypothetical protein
MHRVNVHSRTSLPHASSTESRTSQRGAFKSDASNPDKSQACSSVANESERSEANPHATLSGIATRCTLNRPSSAWHAYQPAHPSPQPRMQPVPSSRPGQPSHRPSPPWTASMRPAGQSEQARLASPPSRKQSSAPEPRQSRCQYQDTSTTKTNNSHGPGNDAPAYPLPNWSRHWSAYEGPKTSSFPHAMTIPQALWMTLSFSLGSASTICTRLCVGFVFVGRHLAVDAFWIRTPTTIIQI